LYSTNQIYSASRPQRSNELWKMESARSFETLVP